MLHFLLNSQSIFDSIKFLQNMGFHNNSFIIGPLLEPDHLNIRHLPTNMLDLVEHKLVEWIDEKPGFLLENGLRNMLQYIRIPMEKNIDHCLSELAKMDQRRNIDSKQIFAELYQAIGRE